MTAKHLRMTFAVVGCISLLTAAGCSRPKQYRLGEAIPIGSYTMSISMTEMTHLVHQRQLVVFYRSRTNMLRRKSCWQQCIALIELLTKSLKPTMKTPGGLILA